MRHGSCVRCSLFPAPGLRTGRRGGCWRRHFGGGIGARSGRCTGTTSRMRAAGALGGDGGWRWTPRILVVIDGVCAPAWAAITSELSLAYIGTASRTVQRDELKPRSRRFRLGGKKEAAGVCRGRGRYKYIYGFSIAFFLIGLHSSCEFAEFRAIRHGCFSIRLFTSCDSHPKPASTLLDSPCRSGRGACGFVLVRDPTGTMSSPRKTLRLADFRIPIP